MQGQGDSRQVLRQLTNRSHNPDLRLLNCDNVTSVFCHHLHNVCVETEATQALAL